MIELYQVNPDQVWKRELIGTYKSPEECMRKAKFSKKQMTAGLNGDLVEGKYVIEFSHRFLHNLAIDHLKSEQESMTEEEISDSLGICHQVVSKYLKRGIDKLRKNDRLKKLLHEIIQDKERFESIEIITNRTINVYDN